MNVQFHKNFLKRFAKLPMKIRDRAAERLERFRADPFDASLENHPLTGKFRGSRSINVTGDFRAIYDSISDTEVVFIDIGTHSQLYE
jgi:addiction module RelE/StbE family toxin